MRTAWAEWVNAYHNVKKGDKVYKDGELLGVASGYTSRCTAHTPGSVQLENIWISGQVTKKTYGWELRACASGIRHIPYLSTYTHINGTNTGTNKI